MHFGPWEYLLLINLPMIRWTSREEEGEKLRGDRERTKRSRMRSIRRDVRSIGQDDPRDIESLPRNKCTDFANSACIRFSQSMKWIELTRSSPVQVHEPLILIQSNPADDPEAASNQDTTDYRYLNISTKYLLTLENIPTCNNKLACFESRTSGHQSYDEENCLKSLNMGYRVRHNY